MKKIIQKSKKIIAVVSMCLICATTFAGEAVMLNADVNNSQKTESIVNFAANDIPVPDATIVSTDKVFPYNRLQVKDIDGNAKIVEAGEGVRAYQDVSRESMKGDVWNGTWNGAIKGIYASFSNKYNGIAIQCKGSNPNANNYKTDTNAGWKNKDLDVETTTMNFKVKYFEVGTYDGKPVGAYANIKVTPFKNRTSKNATTTGNVGEGWNWGKNNYGPYSYYPTIQISKSLYSGWVWQNVKEFHVDLEFYYLNTDGTFGNKIVLNDIGTVDSPVADYYTINSLNPADVQEGENPAAYYGPEYVVPQNPQNVKAYVYSGKFSNTIPWSSNIVGMYKDSGNRFGTQYGYNGGTNVWSGDIYDSTFGVPDNWLQNSVTIMPQSTSNAFSFTLGNFMRYPDNGGVPRTNQVWASFSTTPLGSKIDRPLIDLNIYKKWKGTEQIPDSIEVEIYRTIKYKDSTEEKTEYFNTVTVKKENGWKESVEGLLTRDTIGNQFTYSVKEISVAGFASEFTSKTNQATATKNASTTYTITNTKIYELPDAGGIGSEPFVKIGLIIMLCAVSVLVGCLQKIK